MPRNVEVVDQTLTSITLSWEAPQDLGGRDDVSYQLCYELAGVVNCVDVLNTTRILTGKIHKLYMLGIAYAQ